MNKKDWADLKFSNNQSFFNAPNWLIHIIVFIAGAVMTLAYAPFDYWFIPFLSLSSLFYFSTKSDSPKQSAKLGFSFGLGWFGFGISWVHVSIADFGGLPLIASLALMLLLVGYLALYPALSIFLAKRYQSKLGAIGFVVFWLLSEWLRSWVFTGFPWLSIGYTQLTSLLNGFGPIIGEIGLQAIVLLLSVSLLYPRKRLALISFIFLFNLGWALSFINWTQDNPQSQKEISISLVQGNIAQSVKWQPDNEMPTMMKYWQLTEPVWALSDIVIWPEAAIPRLEVMAEDFLMHLNDTANDTNTSLITGIVDYQPDTELAYNNVIVLGKSSKDAENNPYTYKAENRYSKHHLLPIGEFVPFESILRTLAPIFDLPMSSFSRGDYIQNNLEANGIKITPAICFEIAFSQQVGDNINQDSDLILTVSNDAWFGNSHGPWQHLQIAQMRALEYAKPVVRVTNNGVTAIIDHKGNIQSQLPQNVADVLSETITLNEFSTPYKKHGNSPLIVLIIILNLFILYNKKFNL